MPLFSGFDPTRDTAIDLLHTILLGIVKYVRHMTHTTWKDAEKRTFAARLQSTDTHGLSVHLIRAGYVIQYANPLIGQQLKTLSQVRLFHVHDLVDSHHFSLWKASDELAALLWLPEIDNMDEYLV